MSNFEITSNANALAKTLGVTIKGMFAGMKQAMKFAMYEFQGDIVRTQMSGRVNNDYGLNRQSGHLAQGWSVIDSEGSGVDSYRVRLANQEKYGVYHEAVDRGKAKYPKRLWIHESFPKWYPISLNAAVKRYVIKSAKAIGSQA